MSHPIENPPTALFFDDDGQTPNSRLPVLLYRHVALEKYDIQRPNPTTHAPSVVRIAKVSTPLGRSCVWRRGCLDGCLEGALKSG
ncbi:hypothetical protein ACYZTX_17030 [Pseudomonas sp. MDT1-17]